MTKTDFFRILIKSIGLYFLISISISYLPSLIGLVFAEFNLQIILALIGSIGFLLIVYVFLIVKTDSVIDLLKINKGFDNSNFDLGNLTKQGVLHLAILIVGMAIMFSVLNNIISYIQIEMNSFEEDMNPYLIGAIIKFVISGVMIIKSKNIASLLLK